MKLERIIVKNYKSIKTVEFIPQIINGSYTYGLLGINESGKSSILKGISLFDNEGINYPMDYFDEDKPISVSLNYSISEKEKSEFRKYLVSKKKFPKSLCKKLNFDSVVVIVKYSPDTEFDRTVAEYVNFKQRTFKQYFLNGDVPMLKDKLTLDSINDEELTDFDIEEYLVGNQFDFFYSMSHEIVFWESTSKYLILDEIDLDEFAEDPEEISIPLLNCFILCGIPKSKIVDAVGKLSSHVAINSLQSRLSEMTTKHINQVWPEHPISITFQIDNNHISLLIEDNGVKYQPKTTSQRSDGFKQFISFLLTISVESHNKELKNKILLIDEPETHLHPPAQVNLLKELIEITSNNNNNILIFATHSNYLIDKGNLDRNYKITKPNNLSTKVEQIQKKLSSYAEVNYEVFNIPTTDYHNELYGFIEFKEKNKLLEMEKNKRWKNVKNNKEYDVSLTEYIRHSIHHPENKSNKMYTEKELIKSIEILRKIKENLT